MYRCVPLGFHERVSDIPYKVSARSWEMELDHARYWVNRCWWMRQNDQYLVSNFLHSLLAVQAKLVTKVGKVARLGESKSYKYTLLLVPFMDAS
ncbi:hypothetical protein Taro_003169 [Colocasia esculenta]|uniref:Uncharacterized protein n=1 Tax=Colocasia esculenta TaxID=4460 RepID=A0A843TN04_COLES|nr:hypothetical protein [Colocasia esculenta]